jgi:LmbE family N-acetylglucosaminyl deacetylase
MPLEKSFFNALKPRLPTRLSDVDFPGALTILVLAPHPDDFDAIGVTMRFLQQQGHQIQVAVLTTGASGVEDGWSGAGNAATKAAIRESEQEKSCAFFGLPQGRLRFLRLWEHPEDAGLITRDNERLREYVLSVDTDCVFLPHGNDSNRTHRRTFETFHAIATRADLSVLAFLNLDAKTVAMRPDIYMPFGASDASWKAELLRMHISQQERNLKSRGYGFDERVLALNRKAAAEAGYKEGYAEVFELQRYGKLAEAAGSLP